MTTKKTKKRTYVQHGITFILIGIFVVLALASGATMDPITKAVDQDVRNYGGNIDGFLFFISADVTLRALDRDLSVDARQTTVRETILRREVRLTANTAGRLQKGDVNSALHVAFEKVGDEMPTIAFVQKRNETGMNDKFYFDFQTDARTRERFIYYQGGRYTVLYTGEEPYLLYKNTTQETTKTRRMSGLR